MRRLHVWRTYSINTTPIAYLCPRVPLSRTHPSPCRLRRGGKEGKLDRLVAPGASGVFVLPVDHVRPTWVFRGLASYNIVLVACSS